VEFVKRMCAAVPSQTDAMTAESALWIDFVEEHRRCLSVTAPMGKELTHYWGNKQYRASKLINAIVLSGLLRNAHKLKTALLVATKFVIDNRDLQRETLAAITEGENTVPSAGTISRNRLIIVAAWLRMFSRRVARDLAKGFVWVSAVDSSPQGAQRLANGSLYFCASK
jgi:hypothetical protein